MLDHGDILKNMAMSTRFKTLMDDGARGSAKGNLLFAAQAVQQAALIYDLNVISFRDGDFTFFDPDINASLHVRLNKHGADPSRLRDDGDLHFIYQSAGVEMWVFQEWDYEEDEDETGVV